MNIGAFGGGHDEVIRISDDYGRIRGVKARVGVFSSDLAVFTERSIFGMVGVTFWSNQLVHRALELAKQTKKYDVYNEKNLLYQAIADLYSAKRQTLHILWENYGVSFKSRGEKKDLADALRTLQLVNSLFIGLRKGDLNLVGPRIQSASEKILQRIGTQPHDQLKRESRNLMVEVGKIVGPTGKNIPQPQISRIEAIQWRLQDRVANIISIEPRILARRQTLISVIDLCEMHFRALEDFLTRLLPNLNNAYFDGHGGYNLSKRVNSRLANLVRDIMNIDIRPFYFPGQMILRETQQAMRLIQAGNYGRAQAVLNTSLQSLQLRIVRTDLENFITHLTRLLFKPEQKLNQAELAYLKERFRNIETRLQGIDDSQFAQPLRREVLQLLADGKEFLWYRRYGQAKILLPVKVKIVAAALLI